MLSIDKMKTPDYYITCPEPHPIGDIGHDLLERVEVIDLDVMLIDQGHDVMVHCISNSNAYDNGFVLDLVQLNEDKNVYFSICFD